MLWFDVFVRWVALLLRLVLTVAFASFESFIQLINNQMRVV